MQKQKIGHWVICLWSLALPAGNVVFYGQARIFPDKIKKIKLI